MISEAKERSTEINSREVLDIDLEADEVRQKWQALTSSWATKPPFFIRDRHGVLRVVCARYADVREVQNDRGERFSVQVPRGIGHERFDFFNGMITIAQVDGNDHDRMRRLLAKPFGAKAIAALEKQFATQIAAMLDEIEVQREPVVDFMSEFALRLIGTLVFDKMLGFGPKQLEACAGMGEVMPLVQDVPPGGKFPEEYIAAFARLKESISEFVDERVANPREDDLVGQMMAARDGADRLSRDELVGNIFAIGAAAIFSTASSLSAALYNLCRHPDQMEALRQNPALLPDAVEELLRYQNAGFLTFLRFAVKDTEVGGVHIPAGTPVELCLQAADYDPAQFPDPLRLDVCRKPRGILSFGGGAHMCIGFQIARMIIRLGLGQILARFPQLRLADPSFVPSYHGMHGELAPNRLPLAIRSADQ